MDIEQVKTFCLAFSGATEKASGPPSNILTFSVADKKFAYFKTSDPEKWRFSIRVIPERYLELTDQPGIKPARYMHRFHWVTVVDVSTVDSEYLKELISSSYRKALSRLSKKVQAQINTAQSNATE